MAAAMRSPAFTPPPASHSEAEKWKSICSQKDLRIYDLEAENAALQARLSVAVQPGYDLDRHSEGPTGDSGSNLDILAKNYEDLRKLYAELQASHDRCHNHITRATRKYDEAKRVVKQWRAYIDGKLDKGIAKDPAGPPIVRTGTGLVAVPSDREDTPKPTSQASPDCSLDDPARPLSRSSSDLPSHQLPYASSTLRHSSTTDPDRQTKRVTSSQTTEGEEYLGIEAHIKQELSDNEPEIVSERVLKRGRSTSALAMPPPRRIKFEKSSMEGPGSAERPQELRSDEYSSPVGKKQELMRMESSDLDAMIGTFPTPRRWRAAALSRDRAWSEEAASPHPSHMMRALSKNSSSLSDGGIADLSQRLNQQETRIPISDLGQAPAYESTAGGGLSSQQPRSVARPRGTLRQISPNVSSTLPSSRLRRDQSKDLADKSGYLAEDGDENTSQVTPKPAEREVVTTKTDATRRLEAMLDSTTPNMQTLQKRTKLEAKPSTIRNAQLKPTDRSSPAIAQSPMESEVVKFQRPRGLEKSPPPVRPEEEPLRLRSASALRLSDFKLNPKYADSSFAFADSIRSRDAKRGLQGDSSKFIDAARAGNLPPTSKTDNEALKDFLGDTYATILKSYSPLKQRETLAQARAWEYANAHGKGRQAFERRSTPPGFWRTEMPTTQEALEDREKAQEQEREKVEERWREAMRGNGRWLFRDE